MSRSPHRFRGDAAECWITVLFGEALRALDRPVTVPAGGNVKLPKSGHWESGLARIRPSLDDALGATAFAVAWRWACAEVNANAWPGLALVAEKAVDSAVYVGEPGVLAQAGDVSIAAGEGAGRRWVAKIDGREVVLRVSTPDAADWASVDRIADVLAAWLDVTWCVR